MWVYLCTLTSYYVIQYICYFYLDIDTDIYLVIILIVMGVSRSVNKLYSLFN